MMREGKHFIFIYFTHLLGPHKIIILALHRSTLQVYVFIQSKDTSIVILYRHKEQPVSHTTWLCVCDHTTPHVEKQQCDDFTLFLVCRNLPHSSPSMPERHKAEKQMSEWLMWQMWPKDHCYYFYYHYVAWDSDLPARRNGGCRGN